MMAPYRQENPKKATESAVWSTQFSIGKMLLWTAIMAGVVTILAVTEWT